MVVIVLTAVRSSLRGELSRWMIEPKAGVFVGKLSARVRDMLWEKILKEALEGSAVMVYSSRTEQGFSLRSYGVKNRILEDFEGVTLIKRLLKRRNKKGLKDGQ